MRIGFVGMTHMGLCYLAASAQKNFKVTGFDLNKRKIIELQEGKTNIKEPRLVEILFKSNKEIKFSSNLNELKKKDIIFISLDTDTKNNGQANFKPLKKLINDVKKNINKKAIIVILSQIRPGFTSNINFPKKRLFYQVETLIFGQAIHRAIYPERIIVGTFKNMKITKEYSNFLKKFNCPIIKMNYESAELTKISINIFLASCLNMTNIIARNCKNISADWQKIVTALKLDRRIGPFAYLKPGLGISGGNIERDLFSFNKILGDDIYGKKTINSFIQNSNYMKNWAYRVLKKKLKKKMIVGILGLAYKENTNSIKNSPSSNLLKKIKSNKVIAYDPLARIKNHKNFEQTFKIEKVIQKSNIILLMTDWENASVLNKNFKKTNLKNKIIIDPFNLIETSLRDNFREYINLGN